MRVFKMNDYDWVCAKSKDEAIDFYKEFDDYNYSDGTSDIIECDIEKECIWYPFDVKSDEGKKIFKMFDPTKRQKYKIGKDFTGSCDSAIRIPFKYAIQLNSECEYPQKTPYIIASTEF